MAACNRPSHFGTRAAGAAAQSAHEDTHSRTRNRLRPEGGDLTVRAAIEGEALAIEVVNSGRIAEPAAGGTQVGLANTRERLRILYGGRASLELRNREPGQVAATVLIPRAV